MTSAKPDRNGDCRRTTGMKRGGTISPGFACARGGKPSLYDGFRVDHLVGFYRTYVRPLDGSAPFFMPSDEAEQKELGETVMRIMMDTNADISVEDLGTVPEFVRESIARLGIPGYKVLRWEPADPVSYPPLSVAMTGTHDTESLAVWWESLTAEERRRFGPDSSEFSAGVRDRILESDLQRGLESRPAPDSGRVRVARSDQPACDDRRGELDVRAALAVRHRHASTRGDRLRESARGWSYRTGRWHPPLESDH